MFYALSIFFGSLVGFALGLTGSGGSLLAVPLLVYGLSIAPREAFGISLAAVGTTALIGLIQRIKAGEVEFGTGLLFAISGMIGAPAGIWLAGRTPEPLLLILFAVLMLILAKHIWQESSKKENNKPCPDRPEDRPTCERMEGGQLKLTSGCAVLLLFVGFATGFVAGMFGMGGGVVIVPALIMFSGMPIHRAVGTSLFIIVLISISGVSSHFIAGRGISLEVTGLFVCGGALGLILGNVVSRRISGTMLQRVFAVGIVIVAIFIVGKTLI